MNKNPYKTRRGFKHGFRYHRGYQTWMAMNKRCRTQESYIRKNIFVCEEWSELNPNGCENFCQWYENQTELINSLRKPTIERTNNQAGYSPDNCTFIELVDQAYNREIIVKTKSGYIGVYPSHGTNNWKAQIKYQSKLHHLGYHPDINAAVTARNNFIIENNLQSKFKIQ